MTPARLNVRCLQLSSVTRMSIRQSMQSFRHHAPVKLVTGGSSWSRLKNQYGSVPVKRATSHFISKEKKNNQLTIPAPKRFCFGSGSKTKTTWMKFIYRSTTYGY